MREILYRAKPYSDEWIYGYYAKKRDHADMEAHYIIAVDDSVPWKHDFFEEYIVDPETIHEFTGMYDKNGNKIFEGDIIRRCRNAFEWEPKDTWEFEAGHVEYRDGGFVVPEMYTYDGCDDLRHIVGEITTSDGEYYPTDILEVIGNIHDNPELLKGATNVSESRS